MEKEGKRPLEMHLFHDKPFSMKELYTEELEAIKIIKKVRTLFALNYGCQPNNKRITEEIEKTIKKILNSIKSGADATIPESVMVTFGLRRVELETKQAKLNFLQTLLNELDNVMLP